MKNMKKTMLAAALAATLLAPIPAYAENEDGSAANTETTTASMPNPIVEYTNVPDLELALGFPVLYLPGSLYATYHPALVINSIGGTISDLHFRSREDESRIIVRTALLKTVNTEDISGYYGVNWALQDVGDMKHTQVNVAITEDGTHVARWTKGRFVFSLAIKDMDEKNFRFVLKNYVVCADRFAYRYREEA